MLIKRTKKYASSYKFSEDMKLIETPRICIINGLRDQKIKVRAKNTLNVATYVAVEQGINIQGATLGF